MQYLYKITNRINGKLYIGQTNNPKNRWYAHCWLAKHQPEQAISYAIAKYGKEHFLFDVIATCKTIQDADYLEQELIKQHESHVSLGKGYNETYGGYSPTQEQRAKQSESMKAKFASGELVAWNKNLPHELNPLTGISRPIEVIRKISETKQDSGWRPSEEHKQAVAQANTGINRHPDYRPSEETKQIWSEQRKGKHFSPSTEFQKGHPGRKGSDNPNFGKPAWNKGKSTPTKLSLEQIVEIQTSDLSHKQLATIYKVSKSLIGYHKGKI